MSEVVEQRASNGDNASAKTSSSQNTRLKKLTSGSEWVSPFRESGHSQKNLRKQLKEDNSIKNIHVPSKFTTHPTLEAQKKEKKEKEKAAKLEKKKKEKEAKEKEAKETADKEDEEETKGVTLKNTEVDPLKAVTLKDDEAEPKLSKDASLRSLKDEPIDTPKESVIGGSKNTEDLEYGEDVYEDDVKGDNESERPLSEAEQAEIEDQADGEAEKDKSVTTGEASKESETAAKDKEVSGSDNIEQEVKETPIELVTQPGSKYEPVPLPNQEILDKLKDKPKLLSRYQELNAAAVSSLSRSLDDPNKVVELGSGLRMTQQQLLDIAAKRVAPVITNINEEVAKTRDEDEIKRKKELDSKVASHEKKLQKDFDKHKKKLEKQKSKFTIDIGKKLEDLKTKMKNSDLTAANFEKETRKEVDTANDDFKERETTAVEKHAKDKDTIIKNHEELEATKKQELEDAKEKQEKTTEEIEELHDKKTELDNANSELSTRIEELTAELNEKTKELDDLKSKHATKEDGISKNLASKEELDSKIATTKKELETKKKRHDKLSAEVGVLGGVLAAYAAKLTNLKSEASSHGERLTDAKKKYKDWEAEKDQLATEIAREHERKRVTAQEEAETRRVEEELEEKRLQKEAERKEAEERVAAKEEEERKLQESHEKAEAERLANDPEHQFMLAKQKRELDGQRLEDERAEKERVYNEHKNKEADEAKRLQEEIEELKQQKARHEASSREEADKLAEAKLLQIEQLKKEHEERVRLFKEKLEFEELQKSRLLDEVDNLNKIKQLREEKARLTSELNKEVDLSDVNKLIEERELEVSRLSKQIELDNSDLNNFKSAQKSEQPKSLEQSKNTAESGKPSKDLHNAPIFANIGGSSKNQSIANKSEPLKSVKDDSTSNNSSLKKSGALATGIASVGVVGATGAGTAAALNAKHNSRDVSNLNETKSSGGGLSKLKSLTKRIRGSSVSDANTEEPAVSSKEKKASTRNAAPVNISKQPDGKSTKTKAVPLAAPSQKTDNYAASHSDASSAYETYSVYEEVSEAEYQKNLGNPNYMEMTAEEFEKHRKAEDL
ncbi:uncharacterized protein AC631_01545 [Debaryomyces fabryi]|uniref:Uncharacterized protein n=1 Tax=Debaryomyces fabryi TaxID=58627 RepID=A0A0V1Q2E1_9ASCO|nr:uncharacterized protein AC631_01545 [Debaryomyces fabryi]KSA02656.1 hypothetical protein AC631_01545 [Debaryomyces fabryi]CUM45684.1 unnamed protein product [Debaryomyces fabryi]